MKNKIKYIISIVMCALFLTACGDYDFIVENQCKLTGNHEVREVDTSYMIYVDDLPDDLVASVNRVVAAQSANKEQKVKTETAQLKAEENKALASTVTSQSLEYQRLEVLREAMKNGSIQKILINGAPILSLSDKDFVTAK